MVDGTSVLSTRPASRFGPFRTSGTAADGDARFTVDKAFEQAAPAIPARRRRRRRRSIRRSSDTPGVTAMPGATSRFSWSVDAWP